LYYKAFDSNVVVLQEGGLSINNHRSLTINLGGGNCKWQPPTYEIPEEIDFYKTMVVGFPSGDKRMTFVQMEALTGWAAKDEWDFEYLGMTNNPFIKANYPHHEGIWGWEDAGDQVVMVVRNIRRSMVEYHDILWDIGYAKTWDEATLLLSQLYFERPPLEDFLVWRDLRVMDEAHWYGWFIDYWMEGGLMRDIFTHKITTPEHWYMLMMPTVYSRDEVAYDKIVGDQVVTPNYDPHCVNDVSGGCVPIKIISAERLVKSETGPAETRKIAEVLINNPKMAQYVIEEEAWDCVWEELIMNRKGLKTVHDRPTTEEEYNFSAEMLEEMVHELDRLITKYSSSDWNTKPVANDLVDLLQEHLDLIQVELDEVNSGNRVLTDHDFLGPTERKKLKIEAIEKKLSNTLVEKADIAAQARRHLMKKAEEDQKDYSDFFRQVEKKLLDDRRTKIKANVFEDEDERRKLSRNAK